MTDFLFAQPSSLTGVGRVLDLGGVFDDYNDSSSEAEADARAARADWDSVAQDLREALGRASRS